MTGFRFILLVLVFLLFPQFIVNGQFSSGSTGADGTLDLSTCPTTTCFVQVPESGILNYSSVNIPVGRSLEFHRNSRNTPVFLLSQGEIVIDGNVQVNAKQRLSGSGGFYGGQLGALGFGPGGGVAGDVDGKWVGPLDLEPIVGGSGGYGEGTEGGGGGGAIVIASSTSIVIRGVFSVGAQGSIGDTRLGVGSKGSGGAVRIVANTVTVDPQGSSFPTIRACSYQGAVPCGVIRIEALVGQLNVSGNTAPAALLKPFTSNTPPTISLLNLPNLSITSVAGYTVPFYAGTRFDTIDLLLPMQIPDPLSLSISASNIPVGTSVQVGFVSGSPDGVSS